MTVARDYDLESRRCRLQVELTKIVENINRDAAKFDYFCLRQLSRPGSRVDIASNRRQGRNASEFVENLRRADIARVDDVLRLVQRGNRFGAKQAVSVGDDADDDGDISFQSASLSLLLVEEFSHAHDCPAYGAAPDLLFIVASRNAQCVKASIERL